MTTIHRYSTQQWNIQRILRFMGLMMLFVFIFSYILFQARYLITGPQIAFTDSQTSTQNTRVVTVSGVTSNISSLELNGKTIYTNPDGVFQKSLVLEDGYTIITLRAEDRFGRVRAISRPFVYVPDTIN